MPFRIAVLIFVIAALAAGIYFFAYTSSASGESASAIEQAHARLLKRPGDWTRVKKGSFEIAITEEGELRPVKVTSLTFLSPGKIGFIVPEGTYVKKGDRVISLETKDSEDEFVHMKEDLAAGEINLAQQEQTRDLDMKRLASDIEGEKQTSAFAELKAREISNHPNAVEKEEARNLLDGAQARLNASQTDLNLFKPLVEQGFGSREELQVKQAAYEKAQTEKERAEMKARVILNGALPDERVRAQLDRDHAALGLRLKQIDMEDQVDTLEVKQKFAERIVVALQRKLEKRRQDLERSTLRAPHDGVVVYRQMGNRGNKKPEVGERVSPWIAPVDLPNYERMKVRTQVPESLIRKIKARNIHPPGDDGPPKTDAAKINPGERVERGSSARVMIKTIPGVVYTAQVTWIDGWARDRNSRLADADIKAQGLSGVKVFDVEVELDQSDPKHLREGFRASVEFPEEQLQNVIAIPEQSVSTVDGISSVMVMNGRTPEPRKITLGQASQQKVVVLSGLNDGEQIYVPRVEVVVPVEEKKPEEKKETTPRKSGSGGSKKSGPGGTKQAPGSKSPGESNPAAPADTSSRPARPTRPERKEAP